MFGFYAYYRGDALFTILPRTRGFDSGSLLILKFNPMPEELLQRARGDARLDTSTRVPGKGWFTFDLASEEGSARRAVVDSTGVCVRYKTAARKS